ncbi:MAG: DUF1926 domain-containing protein [Thermoguttaceae bacterium]|nr:DUF1926 domain-containing protein [Thermoguttaceae bacterium]MDW8037387.1 DUF1926 domain-containing protein [Thermoguttaceae bacterium]
MQQTIRLALVLHNHQPVGNFDHVFEQAYQDSYRPFLEVFARYPGIRISLHISGPLAEWLQEHHPDYLDRVGELVSQGRIEILGGAFYEPILTMIPTEDRIGQIRAYSRWLSHRLGATVRGMWVAERVWEQSLTRDLVDAGIEYTVLDDFHFKIAGLREEELTGYFLTEDEGRVFAIFPGSEKLRYTIPFADPEETIRYLRQIADRAPNAVVTFGDDGEKFGTWPETYKHVYTNRWLERFFETLLAHQSWLQLTTLAEARDQLPPAGRIYLPEASYREMTEWALPTDRQLEYEQLAHQMHEDPRWPTIRQFIRGGYWRNFKVKYPEANEMYARMLGISQQIRQAQVSGLGGSALHQAQQELYRAQCNCAYWHGAFGGLYLPHLRNAVYEHLIAAEQWLHQAEGRPTTWVQDSHDDYNFDGRPEVCLANDKFALWFAPAQGGMLYELDVRKARVNLLATLARRPEAYHQKVRQGASQRQDQVASIHDRIVFKQPGLDRRLQYDDHPRKSLLEHFYEPEVTLAQVESGQARELGDFLMAPYAARVRRNPGRIQLQMIREGRVGAISFRLIKGVTLEAGSDRIEVAYLLENLPPEARLHFAVEFNWAAMPAGAEDRFFSTLNGQRLGHLGTRLDLAQVDGLRLTDQWRGLEVSFHASRPTDVWTFPIETVSQSEAGFELVHQSVVVLPHWHVQADAQGRWSVVLSWSIHTLLAAENPLESQTALAASW